MKLKLYNKKQTLQKKKKKKKNSKNGWEVLNFLGLTSDFLLNRSKNLN